MRSAAQSPYHARIPQHVIGSASIPEALYPNMQQAQSMIILMAMTAWCKEPLVRESLAMSSQVAVFVRRLGIHQNGNIIGQEMSGQLGSFTKSDGVLYWWPTSFLISRASHSTSRQYY